jgi:hypothetical protein
MSEEEQLTDGHTIVPSVAESEFARFAEAMDLDLDVARMDANELDQFKGLKRAVIRAMEFGRLVIDEKGQPIYTPQLGDTKPITFYEPDGAVLLSSDKKKAGEGTAKMYAQMAAQTKTNADRFANMKGRDLKVCQALYLLFLA